MDKAKKVIFTLSLLLLIPLVGLLIPSKVNATQFHFESYSLAKEDVVDEDIYIVADEIRIDGIVHGDVIAIGDSIQLNGTVVGDAYLIGSKIDVQASIYGITFLFGNNSTVEGLLAENTYIFSSFLNYNADTGKNLFTFFLESSINGSVGGNLRAFGSKSVIDAFVNKDLLVLAGQYSIEEEKVVGEIFDKVKTQEIAVEQGVEPSKEISPSWETNVIMAFVGFLSMLLVGFILIFVAPVKSYAIKEKISGSSGEFFTSLAVGFVVLVLVPFPLVVLLLTVIGAPAAIMMLGALLFIFTFGRIWVEMTFGNEVLGLFGIKEYRPYKSLLTGRFISTLIYLIPVVGTLYSMILGTVALGAILRMKKGHYDIATEKSKEYKKKIVAKKSKKSTTKK